MNVLMPHLSVDGFISNMDFTLLLTGLTTLICNIKVEVKVYFAHKFYVITALFIYLTGIMP